MLVGVIAARISNAKLVYDCHELAIAMPRDGQLKRRLIKFYEGILLRFVDIVIMSDGASRANAFRQAHHYDKPIEYIYNCPVEVNVPRDKKDIRDELEIGSTNPIVVYTGMVGLSRGLDVAPVLDCSLRVSATIHLLLHSKLVLQSLCYKVGATL